MMIDLAGICEIMKIKACIRKVKKKDLDGTPLPEATFRGVVDILRTSATLRVSADGTKIGRLRKVVDETNLSAKTVCVSPVLKQTRSDLFNLKQVIAAKLDVKCISRDDKELTDFVRIELDSADEVAKVLSCPPIIFFQDKQLKFSSVEVCENRWAEKKFLESSEYKQSCMLAFKLVECSKTKEWLKNDFERFGTIEYLSFEAGDEVCFIRFETIESCKAAMKELKKQEEIVVTSVTENMYYESLKREYRRINRPQRSRNSSLDELSLECYRNPINVDLFSFEEKERKYRIRWGLPVTVLEGLSKAEKKRFDEKELFNFKLHFMTEEIEGTEESEESEDEDLSDDSEDATKPMKFADEMLYLKDLLEDAHSYARDINSTMDYVERRYRKHMRRDLDAVTSVELMLSCHYNFHMGHLLSDMRNGAAQFVKETNCFFEEVQETLFGKYKMKRGDVVALIRGLLGPRFDPDIKTISIKSGQEVVDCVIEVSVVVNQRGCPRSSSRLSSKKEDMILLF